MTGGFREGHMNTEQWAPILKPFWDRGMTSWKESQLIQEAVHASCGQLSIDKVKVRLKGFLTSKL